MCREHFPFRCLAATLFLTALWVLPARADAVAMKNIAPGASLLPFSLPDPRGEVFDSASLAGQPSAVIFWSTWSPRSAEVLEEFKGYYAELAPQGLRVVAVNIDGENLSADKKRAVREYLGRMQLPFPALLDENLQVFSSYGVVAHPSILVANREGMVTYVLGGYPNSLRAELHDHLLKVLGLYREPPKEEPPAVGYIPQGGALPFWSMGQQLLKGGQTDKAMDYFAKAMERDPAFMEPVIMTARLLLVNGQPDVAEEHLKKISADLINRSDVRFALGYLLLARGKTEGADALFKVISDRSPAEGWGWWGLGLAALARGEVPAALERMEKARGLQPDNMEAEDYVRRWTRERWARGETLPDEERFLALFPSLGAARERYRKMLGSPGAAPAP